ncbi:response regulator transcription factor [Streptomyces sp. NPDC005799]|uniref:response regulator transcription factor n=1 Tax=Streptomyces sp. NPDC005799 TaxID=3154678 RepID=UPI0033EFEC69
MLKQSPNGSLSAVAIVSPGDRQSFNDQCPSWIRCTPNLAEVKVTDEVVVFYGAKMGSSVQKLKGLLGKSMPPVLALATMFDRDDAIAALRGGARSYLVPNRCPGNLLWAIKATAYGAALLDPEVTSLLIREGIAKSPTVSTSLTVATNRSGAVTRLSPRESQVMEQLAAGRSVAEVADRLALTEKTVRNYLSSIYAKLNVRRQAEAILMWLGRLPLEGRYS